MAASSKPTLNTVSSPPSRRPARKSTDARPVRIRDEAHGGDLRDAAAPLAGPSMNHLVPCPTCHGTGQNPEAPGCIADDFGTCLECCDPLHPRYAAHHGCVLAGPDPALTGPDPAPPCRR